MLISADKLIVCMQSIQEGVEKGGLFSTTSRAAYWSYHLGRSAFFVVQGVIGAVGFLLVYQHMWQACMGCALQCAGVMAGRLQHSTRQCVFLVSAGLLAARTASVATGESESTTGVKLEGLFKAGTARPVMEALTTYAQDLQNIECALEHVHALWWFHLCSLRHLWHGQHDHRRVA